MFRYTDKQNLNCIGKISEKKYIEVDVNELNRDTVIKTKAEITPSFSRFNKDRSIYMLAGPSGAGKSHFIKNLCKSFVKLFKKSRNKVYLISSKVEDPTLDSLPFIQRIDVDMVMKDGIFELSHELNDSLFIFDDTESFDKLRLEFVYNHMISKILMNGRSYRINCCVSTHMNSKIANLAYFEAHYLVVYLNAGGYSQTEYMLNKKIGISIKEIKKHKKLNSRWYCYFKCFPQFLMYEHGAEKI
jgi:energy-coupling factor transporter ATP-binding protein EcfA2